MNKKAVSFIATGLIIASSVTVFAASTRKIEVYDNIKSIVVNKVNKPFTRGEEPFTHNGRTYVPLRYVSEALGENVDWDSKTGTVYIGDRYNTTADFWYKNLTYMSNNGGFSYTNNATNLIKNNASEEFSNYLHLYDNYTGYSKQTFIDFPLHKKYKTFKSRVGISNEYKNCPKVKVNIYVDDKIAYSKDFKQGDMPEDVSINLTGGNKIRFEILNDSGYSIKSGVIFGNGQFIK